MHSLSGKVKADSEIAIYTEVGGEGKLCIIYSQAVHTLKAVDHEVSGFFNLQIYANFSNTDLFSQNSSFYAWTVNFSLFPLTHPFFTQHFSTKVTFS